MQNIYLPALGTHGPRREPVVNCAQKDWHNSITQTQIHTDIGDQYSATINVRDRPSRLRTWLICKVGHREYSRKFDDDCLFIVKLTHSKRNLRSICLMASRRKPAPPVVYARGCLLADGGPIYEV